MDEYLNAVEEILSEGKHKPNRTGVDTISNFSVHYKIDLQEGYPLLTTKKMSDFRWNSMLHEFFWYLSGEGHVQNLQEETAIWDAWSDENGHVETSYARFWRRFPTPESGVPGEAWITDDEFMQEKFDDDSWMTEEVRDRWVNEEEDGTFSFDQIQYAIDRLKNSPNSRRIVINAWHPGNASASKLPPCHFTFVFNVQGDTLNTHLTQRSGDIALGVPFNIAAYALLTHIMAQEVGLEVGEFSHTIVDGHAYCGTGERGDWYGENLDTLQEWLSEVEEPSDFLDVREKLMSEIDGEDPDELDHVPNLLTQLSRTPHSRPTIDIADKPLEELAFEDVEVKDYTSHDGLTFGVAE